MKQTAASLRASLDAVRTAPELLGIVQAVDGTAIADLPPSVVAGYRERFAPHVLRFIALEELRETEALRARAGKLDGELGALLGENRWGAYRGMARALELADLSGCARVAMVGCGAFPDSLFCLHDRTPVQELVGFDRDPAAAAAAGSLVEALGLERITVRVAEAAETDYGSFDAVCVSAFAVPRGAVLERIASTAPVGATVIAREPILGGLLLFEPVLAELPDGLQLLARGESAGGPLGLAYAALAVTASRNDRSVNPSGTRST